MATSQDASLYRREPARVIALVAGALTSLGTALVQIGQGASVLVAAGTALVQIGVVVGAGEVIRSQVTPAGDDQ